MKPVEILAPAGSVEALDAAIGEGADADLVVFDLERSKANAAARGSGAAAVFSEGIEHVFVNGEPVIKNGHLVEDARPGRALMPKTRIWRL